MGYFLEQFLIQKLVPSLADTYNSNERRVVVRWASDIIPSP
jgi:hypothetical protein